MLSVDPEETLPVAHQCRPWEDMGSRGLTREDAAAEPVDLRRLSACCTADSSERVAKWPRGTSSGLLHINVPFLIECVWQIYENARKLVVLFFLPPESKPVTRNE